MKLVRRSWRVELALPQVLGVNLVGVHCALGRLFRISPTGFEASKRVPTSTSMEGCPLFVFFEFIGFDGDLDGLSYDFQFGPGIRSDFGIPSDSSAAPS